MKPWDRTLQDRWDDLERFLSADWRDDEPGPRLVEAVEALVDEWWNAAAERLGEEMERQPRLKRVVAACDFDQRVPSDVRDLLYRLAEDPPAPL